MLRARPHISDLIFSPGRAPLVQLDGQLLAIHTPALDHLSADDTRRIASHLIGANKAAINVLREQGYCDISYALPGIARFRVNVFIQRGSCAVVMRVIPTTVPDLKSLNAPEELRRVATLRDGLVLVAGPRGSGKSSTLAALVDEINRSVACHILTIEDPIEFLHSHKAAIVHQRELHSDTPSVAHAMCAALRQAPNVIVVGELKGPESIELALEAGETGHLVLSTVTTMTAAKAVGRLLSPFPLDAQPTVRQRLARMLRYIICQRLIPRNDGARSAVFELADANSPELDLQAPDTHPQPPHRKRLPGIDGQLEALVQSGAIARETALAHALDPAWLSQRLSTTTKPRLR
jgi:twitching motility protein PilT